ncbi:hypothetical protein [Allokutzneria sp. NRRL B-24872]|nr:hypothetical protein [Allokutzneria sp. NRRL B-24872]
MQKHPAELRDVYGFLEEVRERPGMWVRQRSVHGVVAELLDEFRAGT